MTQDVAAARVLADKLAVERSEMVGTGRSKDRRMASDRREAATTIRSLLARVAALEDSNEGLTADLHDAVQTAYNRGATEWARLNYPKWVDLFALSAKKSDSQKGGGA
jgi:hypothetical protein